jgi:O-antigen/teichoic acid export membrane protein
MLKNGIYNVVGAGIRICITLLTIPILIRLVGVGEYGLWTLVSTVVNLVSLAEAGLSVSTTFFLAQDLERNDTKGISQVLTVSFGTMFLVATMIALIMWIGSESFINLFPKLSKFQHLQATEAMKYASLLVWSRLLQQICIGVEQALQNYGAMNVLITTQAIASNIGVLITASMGGKTLNFMQLQAALSAILLLAHLLLSKYLLRMLKLRPCWGKEKAIAIGKYSFQTWITSLGSALFANVDRLIVGFTINTEALGVYAAITSTTSQVNVFSSLPIQPLIPSISVLYKKKDRKSILDLKKCVKKASLINIGIAITLGGILLNAAPYLLKVLLGANFNHEYVKYFQQATVIYSIYSINAVGYYTLFGAGLVTINMIGVATSGSISLLLIWLLSAKFGLAGAIAGNSGYVLTTYLSIYALKISDIQVLDFLRWLSAPLIWLLMVSIIALAPINNIFLTFIITVGECLFMAYWFMKCMQDNNKQYINLS